MSFLVMGSLNGRPIRRLMAEKVLLGLVIACRLADWPTSRSPSSVKATTDGVVRAPSEFSITLTSEPSMMATHEFVVPRSMPIAFAIETLSYAWRRPSARSTAGTPRNWNGEGIHPPRRPRPIWGGFLGAATAKSKYFHRP